MSLGRLISLATLPESLNNMNYDTMNYEYAVECNKQVSLVPLQAPPLNTEDYSLAHKHLPIVTHDVAINYQGKILLVVRKNLPAENILCVIGGRVQRGLPLETSLRKKVKEECGLDLKTIISLGYARTFFQTDPFGHGHGTDTINLMFYAEGSGTLVLDHLHTAPVFINAQNFRQIKKTLHPYVQEIVTKALRTMKKNAAPN